MSDRRGYYAIIPASVRYDDRLKPNAKLLYGEITALCSHEGYCWAGNEYFAELYGVDNSTVSRWISQLVEFGYVEIEVIPAEGNKRKIFIENVASTLLTKKSRPIDKKVKTLLTKKSRPIDKKVKPIYRMNNTINNTSDREEEKPLAFLERNFPSRIEVFMMKYRKRIPDWEAFCSDYDLKIVEEQKVWEQDVLFARLERLANNWIRNEQRSSSGSTGQAMAVAQVPAYMKKSLK